MVLMVLALSG